MAGSTPAFPSGDPAFAAASSDVGAAAPDAWRRFRRHRLALVSLAVLAILVLAVVLGPALWSVAIDDIDFSAMLQ